jgi:mono/diheme cytochrome c family protein
VVFTLLLLTVGVQGFMALGSSPVRPPVERTAPPPAGGPVPAETRAAVDGAALYLEHCASCHQPDGSGIPGVFSPLVGERVASADSVVARVLRGGAAMPPFAQLSDAEVAAVVTHVRTAWGNGFGAVSPEDVAARR